MPQYDPPSVVLEAGDDLHRADLRRARHRAAREQRAEDVDAATAPGRRSAATVEVSCQTVS